MTAAAALGAVATLVSTAFCLSTLERFRANGRPHELAWTIAMAMFALASLAYFAAAALGWGGIEFRTFYLFGAILNVPYLALGTVYLLGGSGPRAIASGSGSTSPPPSAPGSCWSPHCRGHSTSPGSRRAPTCSAWDRGSWPPSAPASARRS